MSLIFKVGKIVGGSKPDSWSQTHVFLPEDREKQKQFGYLLAAFSLKAKEEDLDIPSFGKEVISRFHEIYYSSTQETVFEKLKISIADLTAEFSQQVEIGLCAAVIIKKEEKLVGYFSATPFFEALILRAENLVPLFGQNDKLQTASGFLQNEDMLVVATKQFLSLVPQGSLKAGLENKDITEAVESVAPIVHGHSENSQAAAVLFQVVGEQKEEKESLSVEFVKEKETVEEDPEIKTPSEAPVAKQPFFKRVKWGNVKVFSQAFISHIKSFKKEPSLYVSDEKQKTKGKKTTFTIAVVLIGLLLVSVFLGLRKKTSSEITQVSNNLIQEVSYRYEQALSLEEINPLRAKLLLQEARQLLTENQEQSGSKDEQEKLLELQSKINDKLQQVDKEYELESADIFLDISLVKEGFKGEQWAVYENDLFIFDTNKGTVLQVDLSTKAVEVVAGGEKLQGGRMVGAAEGRVFVLTTGRVLVVSVVQSEVIDEVEAEDWGQIVDMVGFASNAYLLDSQAGQIWKYAGLDKGLGSGKEFLKTKTDFSQAKALAIDGSVWVVFANSRIAKFVRGVEDNFILTGLTKPFSSEVNIYTDENLDNLYILDRKNTRIVVISKTGDYQSQYVWSGIAGVTDIFGFEQEGKVLLLTGERVYEISLR